MLSAEQENRVKIPNGTAAVSAEVPSFDESRSLKQFGKAEGIVELLLRMRKSEDLRTCFNAPRNTVAQCHGKSAVVPIGCHGFLFWEE